ncbi:MAG: hypothetical protein H0U60_11160 [Blastocatellia bacterium]|nr:hypothetical protein [Blastocatellia bacterium]
MPLVDFQTALGRLVGVQQGTNPLDGLNLDTRESQYLEALQKTPGFLFSRSIQRSWCIGRAAKSAHLTLSFLPENERQELLNEWIDSGAGTQSFYDAQAGAFLDFISRRLINPSHEFSVCQLEQATLLVGEGRNYFTPPGAEHFCHAPSAHEIDLWDMLESPQSVAALLSQPHQRHTLEDLLSYGIVEYAD